jgi:hypothetical protein
MDVGDVAHPVLDAAQYVKKLATIFKNDRPPFDQTTWILETINEVPDSVRGMREYNDLIQTVKARLA